MKIEAADAFYLRLPEVRDIGDGSQDALLMRIAAGGVVGWGQCDASPLTTLAALVAPLSHSACHPVIDSVLGADLDGPESIQRINRSVRERSADLLQSDHALAGIDVALWDLLGKLRGEPVWSLLGQSNEPKFAYASVLFGDTLEQTGRTAERVSQTEFRAAKFGWGPFGRSTLDADEAHLLAARAGLGADRHLMVDAGCVFGHDVEEAAKRLQILETVGPAWFEEPFAKGALAEYAALAKRSKIPLAAGESTHIADQARHLIDYGGVRFIQIDAGRMGITSASEIARYAAARNVSFVNHTFTSNLALSASLQAYAGHKSAFAEIPFQPSSLATAIGGPAWLPDGEGQVIAPSAPGLGVSPNIGLMRCYLQEVELHVQGRTLISSNASTLLQV